MQKFELPALSTSTRPSQTNTPTDEDIVQGPHSDRSAEKVKDGSNSRVKKALNPTRYGDWEKNGRCIDF